MSNGVKKPHKEMQVTTTSQNHKKQTQYHQRERKNYHKLKKKRPQTTRVSKLLDSKQKQHYLPMNLKPPQTQSHHTLRSTRNWLKIAGKRAKLPDSKQQNYETSKQKTQTKRYESQNNCEEMQNYHCQTQKHEKDTQNHHKEMQNYQRLKTVKTPKNA